MSEPGGDPLPGTVLDAIKAATWADSHLVTASGPRWLGVVNGAWALGTAPTCARGIAESDFDALVTMAAQPDGSLRDASGAPYWLATSGTNMAALVTG